MLCLYSILYCVCILCCVRIVCNGGIRIYSIPIFLRDEVIGAINRLNLSDDIEFSKYLLEKAQVAVIPGSAFGAPGHIRISFATSMELLEKAMDRIKRVVE